MQNPWKTLTETTVYDNAWIKVTHREVINPKGGDGIYGVVHFKNVAVGVIPLDEAYNTWIVGQYRYPTAVYSWEIPEGGGKIGVSPLLAAQRELKEEVGITAQEWVKIMDLQVSNSVTDEVGVVYVAKNLSFGETEHEETEQLEIRRLPFEELYQMTLRGEVTDAISVAAIFKTKLLIMAGEL